MERGSVVRSSVLESGNSLIGAGEGVVKAKDFMRKPENGGRWKAEDFDKFVDSPWGPYPGAKRDSS